MNTHVATSQLDSSERHSQAGEQAIGQYLVPIGRALFAAIFVVGGLGQFSPGTVAYAASQGVPLASIAVPLAGILAILGGLSVAAGYRTKLGAWALVLFLVPVTLMMHRFWAVTDPIAARLQQVMFLKNVSMLGGALLLAWFGAGPVSMDAWRKARREPGQPHQGS